MISYKEILKGFGFLLSVFLLIQKGDAYEFKVGGSGEWAVAMPNDPNASSYNDWAERSRFQVGDTLLFVYQADKDSVLYVSEEDYNNCNTESPLKHYNNGHTIIKFDHSGPQHFISGIKDNCLKNEKVLVVVMVDRSNQTTSSPPPPSPSPPPSVEEPPSPPPTGSPETNPTPTPSEETPIPPKSDTPTILTSFVNSIGAFIGSSLLLVL